jgi:hypothetical protein
MALDMSQVDAIIHRQPSESTNDADVDFFLGCCEETAEGFSKTIQDLESEADLYKAMKASSRHLEMYKIACDEKLDSLTIRGKQGFQKLARSESPTPEKLQVWTRLLDSLPQEEVLERLESGLSDASRLDDKKTIATLRSHELALYLESKGFSEQDILKTYRNGAGLFDEDIVQAIDLQLQSIHARGILIKNLQKINYKMLESASSTRERLNKKQSLLGSVAMSQRSTGEVTLTFPNAETLMERTKTPRIK